MMIQMAGHDGPGAILRSVCKSENFLDSLAWSFRWWFIGLPFGIGLGTAKACIKLWLGFNPRTLEAVPQATDQQSDRLS